MTVLSFLAVILHIKSVLTKDTDINSLCYICYFHSFLSVFSLTIFSIKSTHGLLSVNDFKKILLHILSVFEETWCPVITKVWLAKPLKLCIIPILFLHDCCGMFKSCVINLKVTPFVDKLFWNVSFANISQT